MISSQSNGRRHNETPGVIGVFANQIDTARTRHCRRDLDTALLAEFNESHYIGFLPGIAAVDLRWAEFIRRGMLVVIATSLTQYTVRAYIGRTWHYRRPGREDGCAFSGGCWVRDPQEDTFHVGLSTFCSLRRFVRPFRRDLTQSDRFAHRESRPGDSR
jgi:hypothetical protein